MLAHQQGANEIKKRRAPWKWRLVGAMMAVQSSAARVVGRTFFFRKGSLGLKRIDNAAVNAILVLRLDGVGDVVMTSGFLRALRNLFQGAQITLFVSKDLVNLVQYCPYVDTVQPFDAGGTHLVQRLLLPLRAAVLARRSLAQRHFDLAINPRWDTDGSCAGLLAYFAGPVWSVAYSENVNERKQYYNRGFDRLFSHVIEGRKQQHEIEHNLNVVRFLGGIPDDGATEVWLADEDRSFAERMCGNLGRGNLLVAFGPGAGHSRRVWPLQNFVEVASWLNRQYNARVIVLGNAGEKSLGEAIIERLGPFAVSAIGQTTLRQACALLERCDLYVGNDSGPLHLASAVHTPVVEISCHPLRGSDANVHSPTRFGPWTEAKVILQPAEPESPCVEQCEAREAHCIKRVSLEDVQKAVVWLFSTGTKKTSER